MTISKLVLPFATLLVCSSMVAAEAPNEGDPVVVTGKTQDVVRDEAKSFVRRTSATPIDGQYARWKAPVCVKVTGISEENAAFVAGRIAGIAIEAGIKVAKAGCKPNLVVAFAYDANVVSEQLLKREIRTFEATPLSERPLIYESELPVRWWYLVDSESSDGIALRQDNAPLLGARIQGGSGNMGNGTLDSVRFSGSYRSSLIESRVRVKIEGAVVVVDAGRAEGKSLSAVTAYAAMVSLARVRLGAKSTDDRSILSLFSGGAAAPSDLSENDRAFLAALYRVPALRDVKYQEGAIVAEMVKAITEGSRPGRLGQAL